MGGTAIESRPIRGSYGGDALSSTAIQATQAMTLGNHSNPITCTTWQSWGPLQYKLNYGGYGGHAI